MSNELTVKDRAVVALGYENEKQLVELAGKSKELTKVTNDDSYKQIHSARMALKNCRVEIEKRGKAAREDATKFSKAVIEEEKRLIGLIQPEESRLQAIQAAHDDAVEIERQRKVEIEMRRVQDLQDRLTEIRAVVEVCTRYNCTSDEIAEHMGDIERIPVDDTFQEFRQQAEEAKAATLNKLRDAHVAAKSREEEKRKADEAHAELAKLRAEAAARDARERAEREAREMAERQQREAAEKAQREQLAAEQAERARLQKIEQDRINAENKKLADERAAFDRQQAEARRQAEAEEARKRAEVEAERKRKEEAERLAKKAKYPGDAAIVSALMEHFGVPEAVVKAWFNQLRKVA